VAGCGAPEDLQRSKAPLTATDVDVAPECQGVLQFANTASFATLDLYLPSNLVTNMVNQRAIAAFTSIADLSAVDQMGAARLTQLHGGALAEGYIGSSCVGIYDELAVSTDDQAAMVALVNSISDTELHDVLPYAWNGAVNLLAGRPYSSVLGISSTSGIGPVSLRNIRNAATLSRPLEELAAAVNALHNYTTILRHFDWYEIANNHYYYQLNGMTCFGINPDYLPNGAEIRPNLATPTEVHNNVAGAVAYANRYNQLPISPAPGLANLDALAQGGEFFGCYIDYAPDPWSGYDVAFFVHTETGFGVLTETGWSE
jgi:hypothetical protein